MTRKRVLILIKGLGLGGAENLLVAAAPHLDHDRFDYHIGYFLPWKNALVEPLTLAGLPVCCFDIRWMADLRAVVRVRKFVKQRGIQLIHAHLPWPSVIARAVARCCNVKLVYTEHGCWERLNPITRVVNRATFGWNDLSIAVSDDVAQSMAGIRRGQLRTITNGVDCERLSTHEDARQEVKAEFGIPHDHRVIGKIANLTRVKNHVLLIRAFASLLKKVPAATLLLVGQLRESTEMIRQLVQRLGIEDRVILAGPRNDVPRILTAVDVLAFSSHTEGVPVALLEGMALGCAVVCTRVGGIPGVIEHGRNGLLVDPGNTLRMTQALEQVAQDDALATRLARAASTTVRERFDIAQMVRQVESSYGEVLQ